MYISSLKDHIKDPTNGIIEHKGRLCVITGFSGGGIRVRFTDGSSQELKPMDIISLPTLKNLKELTPQNIEKLEGS